MPQTVSDFELWYTTLNAIGALFVMWLCVDVWHDIFDRDMLAGNTIRRQAARLCLCFATFKTLIMVGIVCLGVTAMTQPSTPRPDGTHGSTPTQIAAVMFFTLVPFAAVTICAYWKYLRVQARQRGSVPQDLTISGSHVE